MDDQSIALQDDQQERSSVAQAMEEILTGHTSKCTRIPWVYKIWSDPQGDLRYGHTTCLL